MRKALAALVLFVCAAPHARADVFDEVRAFIRRQLTERQTPSVAVAVARDGKVVWEEAFGWANREDRVPATEHTLYSLASISKPITATGLMVLVHRGKVDLDRPVNDYLGEAKVRVRVGDPAAATVRRVANHSAGLPLHYQFFYADEPYRAPDRDETIRRYGSTVTAPGERYEYSNLGYGILDHVITRVSGRPYADFMRQEVFLPLGLTHTSVDLGPGLEKYQAIRYGTDSLPIPFYAFDHPGASAVYASAHDLVRFGLFHVKAHLSDQKAILPDELVDAMQQATVDRRDGTGYGVGWWVEPDAAGPGRPVVTHTGSMGGVSTVLRLVPADRAVIVVLSNANSDVPRRVADRIQRLLYPQAPERKPPPNAPAPAKVSDLEGQWQGPVTTYQGDVRLRLTVLPSGDVHVQLGDQLITLLNDAAFRDGYLTGRMLGDVGTADANRRPYTLRVDLKRRGDRLQGGVAAVSLPGKRAGNALTYWVDLKKQ